jgi:hypothetical protein
MTATADNKFFSNIQSTSLSSPHSSCTYIVKLFLLLHNYYAANHANANWH